MILLRGVPLVKSPCRARSIRLTPMSASMSGTSSRVKMVWLRLPDRVRSALPPAPRSARQLATMSRPRVRVLAALEK